MKRYFVCLVLLSFPLLSYALTIMNCTSNDVTFTFKKHYCDPGIGGDSCSYSNSQTGTASSNGGKVFYLCTKGSHTANDGHKHVHACVATLNSKNYYIHSSKPLYYYVGTTTKNPNFPFVNWNDVTPNTESLSKSNCSAAENYAKKNTLSSY